MPLVNPEGGYVVKSIDLDVEQRQVILVALAKFDTELSNERLETIPGNTKEREIDATRLVIKTLMGTVG